MLIFLVVQVRRWVLDVLNPSLAYSLLSLLQQCYIQLFTVYFQWISTDHDSDRDWLPRILQMFGCVFLHSVWVCLKTKWTPPQNLWGFERITRITHHPPEFSDIPKTVPRKNLAFGRPAPAATPSGRCPCGGGQVGGISRISSLKVLKNIFSLYPQDREKIWAWWYSKYIMGGPISLETWWLVSTIFAQEKILCPHERWAQLSLLVL